MQVYMVFNAPFYNALTLGTKRMEQLNSIKQIKNKWGENFPL